MTKEKFEKYKCIQESGRTNMMDIRNVIQLSGGDLNKSDCFDIMDNFDKYEKGDF